MHIVHRAPGTHPSLAHFPIDAEQGEDAHGESKPGHPHENSGGVTSQQSRLPLLSTTDQSHLAEENKFNCGSRRSHKWSLHNRRIAKCSSDNQKTECTRTCRHYLHCLAQLARQHKLVLLDWINHIWETSSILANLKETLGCTHFKTWQATNPDGQHETHLPYSQR